MHKKTTQILKYPLSFVLAAVLLYFAFRKVDWNTFWLDLLQTSWIWVILFAFVSVLALVFRQRRWTSMLRTLDPEYRRSDVWDSINVGNLVNTVLPGAGEFVRCGYMVSARMSYDKVLGTIVAERVFDVVAIAVILLLAFVLNIDSFGIFFKENISGAFTPGQGGSIWWLCALTAVMLVAFFFIVFRFSERNCFFGKISGKLSGLLSGFAVMARMERKYTFVLNTILIWVMYLAMTFCIFKAVPMTSQLGISDALFVCAVGNLSSVIPVPGGMGAYHYMVALALQSVFGVNWESGVLFATLSHESHAILIILLGIISYICLTLRKNKAR